jgi:hypothetical protein
MAAVPALTPADYYQILDIPKTATESEIKKAYRRQALVCVTAAQDFEFQVGC